MSSGVCGNDNATTGHDLSYTLQSPCGIALDGNIEHMREESNQSDQHVEPCEPIKSTSCAASGTACTRSPTCNEYGIPCRHSRASTRSAAHTSFPCAHCRDNDSSSTADYIERDYAEYIASSGATREDTGARIWASNEPGNFKQADADSGDSIERRIGISAGVTV